MVYILDGSVYKEVLENLYWDNIPILVQGNVQVMLNRLEKSWVATFINNNGVIKSPATAEVNDGKNVEVIFGSRTQISDVKVWRSEHKPSFANGQYYVKVNSGDVAVLEILDGK